MLSGTPILGGVRLSLVYMSTILAYLLPLILQPYCELSQQGPCGVWFGYLVAHTRL
jgi:hypothetical protein